jgi:class 3 adenylate cyclase/tetratricopeptide (TPR) repeat protein
MSQLNCRSCGRTNASERKFCTHCGARLVLSCLSCGQDVALDANFCGNCGAAQPGSQSTRSESQATRPGQEPRDDGERRQLTVLFADLVGSTELSQQLDLEEYRDLLRAYSKTASEVVPRLGGYIAQYQGDGILAYFGWPEAHDYEAERAVRAALALIAAVQHLNQSLQNAHQLAVRVGIHTGPVVIGQIGGSGRREVTALGETPNVAARVQAVAPSNGILITAATHRLVSGLFVVEAVGARNLKGVAQPLELYRIRQPSGVRSRLRGAGGRGLTPFVGREHERGLLHDRWELVREGKGQLVLMIGEAGIGKSRLVQSFHDDIAGDPHIWLECGGGPLFENTPLYAISEMLKQGFALRGDSAEERLKALEDSLRLASLKTEQALPLVAPLLELPVPEQYPPPLGRPEEQRLKLLSTLCSWALGSARAQPMVIVMEDLHWADPSTLELARMLAEQMAAAPLFLICTARPEFAPPWRPGADHAHLILNRLNSRQARELVASISSGVTLPDDVVNMLIERSAGVPLFLEELTRAVLEEEGRVAERYIPVTLQESLLARLDRLGPAREVAQIGAVIGREFSYALLEAITALSSEALEAALSKLVDVELLYAQGLPPEATYTFKHALVQDAAYETLLKSRRRELHRNVAQVLGKRFKEVADAEPEVLAYHYAAAGDPAQAISAWQRAAEQAMGRGALKEAEGHLRSAIAGLSEVAMPERIQRELPLQLRLGQVLQSTHGYTAAETDAAFTRARTLARELGNPGQLVRILRGHFGTAVVGGQMDVARTIADELYKAAQLDATPATLVVGHFDQGVWRWYRGLLSEALPHFQQAADLWDESLDREIPNDAGIEAHSYMAYIYVHLGMADKARAEAGTGVALAKRLMKPFDIGFTRHYEAYVQVMLGNPAEARESAELGVVHCKEAGVPFFARTCSILLGWAITKQGNCTEGIKLIRENLALHRKAGTIVEIGYYLGLLAEAQMCSGDLNGALETVTEALTAAPHQEIYLPYPLWVRGEVLLRLSSEEEAEQAFSDAVAFSRGIEDRLGELRATTALARMLKAQDHAVQARELLAPVFNRFTEGFDTPIIAQAGELLGQTMNAVVTVSN